MKIEQVIQDYLAAPADRKAATLEELARRPDEAFNTLMTFKGPYPKHAHAIDVFPDYLAPLLRDLLLRHPRLLFEGDLSEMPSGKRWILLDAAISSQSPQFVDLIIAGLSDRAVDVKQRVVNGILEHAFLRTPAARPLLEELLALKSMAWFRGEIQRALDSIDKALGDG